MPHVCARSPKLPARLFLARVANFTYELPCSRKGGSTERVSAVGKVKPKQSWLSVFFCANKTVDDIWVRVQPEPKVRYVK